MIPEIDATSLDARLRKMGSTGASPGGGVTRPAFSAADVAARGVAEAWMVQAGLETELDGATNLIGRTPGTPAIVIGSHLDTVPPGGHLDAGVPVDLDEAHHGHTTGQRLRSGGGRPDDLAATALSPASIAAYVELHIERGPQLDGAGLPVGVGTDIAGRRTFVVDIAGAANDAGTTPMAARLDALCAAAEMALAIEALAVRGAVAVATVGELEISPNAANVVPGTARLGVEMRDIDDARFDAAAAEAQATVAEIARRRNVAARVDVQPPRLAVPADSTIASTIERVSARGRRSMRLFSGAGHDAQVMARICPMGMVFVPSRGGVSHPPLEHTDLDRLIAGADVLLHTVLALDALDDRAFPTLASSGAH